MRLLAHSAVLTWTTVAVFQASRSIRIDQKQAQCSRSRSDLVGYASGLGVETCGRMWSRRAGEIAVVACVALVLDQHNAILLLVPKCSLEVE